MKKALFPLTYCFHSWQMYMSRVSLRMLFLSLLQWFPFFKIAFKFRESGYMNSCRNILRFLAYVMLSTF